MHQPSLDGMYGAAGTVPEMIKYYTPYKLYSIPDGFFVTEQVRMNTAGMEKGEFIHPLLSHSSVKEWYICLNYIAYSSETKQSERVYLALQPGSRSFPILYHPSLVLLFENQVFERHFKLN